MSERVLLCVDGLRKAFAGQGSNASEAVLHDVTFDLHQHETLAVVGRSGSGKTTLLRILAGLEAPDAGRCVLGGRDLAGVAPQQRGVLYLYQEPLLFPHLDVRANLAFGLRLRKVPAAEARQRVDAMLRELDLSEHAAKAPHQLSGGQRQRVSFGRALLVEPRLLLLDEPFGALDADTRTRMQDLFRRIAERYRISALFVTHDLKEAILMGDRVAHLQAGRLRLFEHLEEMVADPDLGVRQELDFWTSLPRPTQGDAP